MTRAHEWALSLAMLLACAARDEAAPALDAPSPPAAATTTIDARATGWTGVVVSTRSHHVAAAVTATIDAVEVDIGDVVHAGEPLVRLHAQPFEDALAIADASVAARTAELAGARAGLGVAESELAATRALAAANHATPHQLHVSEAQRDQAAAQLALGRATLQSARAEQRRARHALDAATVRAPIDGVVAARMVEPGQSVAVGTTLLRVIDPRSVGVRVGLDAAELAALADDTPFVVSCGDERRWHATIRRRAPELDLVTEQVPIELALRDADTPTPAVGTAVFVQPRDP